VLTKEAHHGLNECSGVWLNSPQKKRTAAPVLIPVMEADNYLAVSPQKTHRIISEGRGITLSQL